MDSSGKDEDELLGLSSSHSGEGMSISEKEKIEEELLLLSSPASSDIPSAEPKAKADAVEENKQDLSESLEILDDSSSDVVATDGGVAIIHDDDSVSEESNSFLDRKICIYFCHGALMVWNAEDAQMLREECRIVGKLTGCLPRAPRQNGHLGLPLQLMPEEAKLLVDIDAASVVEEDSPSAKTRKARERAFNDVRQENYKIQQQLYKDCRRQDVQLRMGDIIAGKKAKKRKMEQERGQNEQTPMGDDAESVNNGKDSTDVIEEAEKEIQDEEEESTEEKEKGKEAEKEEEEDAEDKLTVDDVISFETSEKHSLVQIFTENPWKRSMKPCTKWIFPCTQLDFTRYMVFKDLWRKGYFLTSGAKFGGDFLVYPGDPCRFHSHYIAVCMDQYQEIPALDIIAMGRLASNVRKTTLLCTLNRKKRVVYTSLQWTGIS